MLDTYRIESFEDILRALKERPEWLEELRRIILTEELIALPQKFEKFLEEFKSHRAEFKTLKEDFENHKDKLETLSGEFKTFREEEFKPLKEKVDRIEGDVGLLKEDVTVLKQDVTVLKQDVTVLKQDVTVLKQDVAVLKQDVAVLKQDVAELKGDNFERKVRERAPSYFGRFIRRCKVIGSEELANILDDAMDSNVISEVERDDALNTDVVVTGILKHDREKKVVVVTEVSIKADRSDVERAFERGRIIEKAMNLPSISVVIGKEFTEGAEARAKELQVILC
ncbi:MAG: hypothetical protein ACK415_12255 [Thermodesulfovibrionales bacterium]